jgi:hypothetical protein
MRTLTEPLTTSSLNRSPVPQPPEQGTREQGMRNREAPGVSPHPSLQSVRALRAMDGRSAAVIR